MKVFLSIVFVVSLLLIGLLIFIGTRMSSFNEFREERVEEIKSSVAVVEEVLDSYIKELKELREWEPADGYRSGPKATLTQGINAKTERYVLLGEKFLPECIEKMETNILVAKSIRRSCEEKIERLESASAIREAFRNYKKVYE